MRVYFFDLLHRKVATPYAGLIGNHEQRKPFILQATQCLSNSRKNADQFGAMQVIRLLDKRPVAIQKDSLHFSFNDQPPEVQDFQKYQNGQARLPVSPAMGQADRCQKKSTTNVLDDP